LPFNFYSASHPLGDRKNTNSGFALTLKLPIKPYLVQSREGRRHPISTAGKTSLLCGSYSSLPPHAEESPETIREVERSLNTGCLLRISNHVFTGEWRKMDE
jgi:hypothetical protein